MHRTAGRGRLCPDPIEQIQDLSLTIAAIELISGLDDDQLSADPGVALIDRADEPQDLSRSLEVAVDVADRDDTRRTRELGRRA